MNSRKKTEREFWFELELLDVAWVNWFVAWRNVLFMLFKKGTTVYNESFEPSNHLWMTFFTHFLSNTAYRMSLVPRWASNFFFYSEETVSTLFHLFYSILFYLDNFSFVRLKYDAVVAIVQYWATSIFVTFTKRCVEVQDDDDEQNARWYWKRYTETVRVERRKYQPRE